MVGSERYIAQVRERLWDLPKGEREAILDDLRSLIAELREQGEPGELGEHEASGGHAEHGDFDPRPRLGNAWAYARKLRASAGFTRGPHLVNLVRYGNLRRRLVNATIGTVAACVTTAVVSATVWVSHYAPLEPGSSSFTPVADPMPEQAISGFDTVSWRLTYRDGSSVRYALSIRNNGPVSVTITDLVRDESWFRAALRVDQLRVTPDDPKFAGLLDHAEPFHAFRLDPQHERTLVIDAHYDGCDAYAEGTSMTIVTQQLTYRVFGISKAQSVALRLPLQVVFPGPNTPNCPRPPIG